MDISRNATLVVVRVGRWDLVKLNEASRSKLSGIIVDTPREKWPMVSLFITGGPRDYDSDIQETGEELLKKRFMLRIPMSTAFANHSSTNSSQTLSAADILALRLKDSLGLW